MTHPKMAQVIPEIPPAPSASQGTGTTGTRGGIFFLGDFMNILCVYIIIYIIIYIYIYVGHGGAKCASRQVSSSIQREPTPQCRREDGKKACGCWGYHLSLFSVRFCVAKDRATPAA